MCDDTLPYQDLGEMVETPRLTIGAFPDEDSTPAIDQLVTDLRMMMAPYTALKLKVRKKNVLKVGRPKFPRIVIVRRRLPALWSLLPGSWPEFASVL